MIRKHVKPSELPTKRVRAPDGTIIQMKVVQSDSETLADDLLAAFQSNVTRARSENRRVAGGGVLSAEA